MNRSIRSADCRRIFLGHTAADIQREAGGGVSEVGLHRLDAAAAFNGHRRIAVPLRHNKGRPEPPNLRRVGGLPLFFFRPSGKAAAAQTCWGASWTRS